MNMLIRSLILLGLLLLLPLMPMKVYANEYCYSPITGLVNGYDITVNNGASVGQVVGSISTTFPNINNNANCYGDLYYGLNVVGAATDLGYDPYGSGGHLYATTVPGIAYRVNITGGSTYLQGYVPKSMPYTYANPGLAPRSVIVELVKIGNITQGGILNGPIVYFYMTDSGGNVVSQLATYSWSSTIHLKTINPACTVSTPTPYTVNMPTANVADFASVGATSGNTDFNLSLSCTGGTGGGSTGVYMTLTDASNTGNRTNILNLSSGSSALGVGLQVLKGSTIISYGPDSSLVGTQNQFFVQNVATGVNTVTIPLTVRYIRTGAMQPGDVKGIATFTMSYQ